MYSRKKNIGHNWPLGCCGCVRPGRWAAGSQSCVLARHFVKPAKHQLASLIMKPLWGDQCSKTCYESPSGNEICDLSQFSSVQGRISALGKAHLHSTSLSYRQFSSGFLFKAVSWTLWSGRKWYHERQVSYMEKLFMSFYCAICFSHTALKNL